MKAVSRDRYGSPEILEVVEIDRPEPKPGEVRIRLHATALNASDLELLTARPAYGRVTGLFRPGARILGSDVAGTVDAIGDGVTSLAIGDAVFGDIFGTFGGLAEWVCAPASKLTFKPASLTFAQAAAIPQSGTIGLQGIRDHGRVRAGQRVLVNGGGGGGGSFAIQIAKHLGAHVTAVDSAEKLDLMRSLGADRAIDYAVENVTGGDESYDVILDLVGGHALRDFRRVLARGGRYMLVGGPVRLVLAALALGPLASLAGKKMGLLFHRPNHGLRDLIELVESGAVVPAIDRTFPLTEAAAALRYLGDGHAKGKVVVLVEG